MTIFDESEKSKNSDKTEIIVKEDKETRGIPNRTNHSTIKQILLHNEPIEDKLHVIVVISNPCLFKKRYKLLTEFIRRIEADETYVNLYIVELAYGNQNFAMTDVNNPNHLQLRTEVPLWHKENMINLGVKKLLPTDWKAFAWIDSDIEFENINWATDTLKILNGYKDIVQLFSHALDLDSDNLTMSVFSSFCYQHDKGYKYSRTQGVNYWHPGYSWACTRQLYEKMEGLFEYSILGSADYNMAMSLIGQGDKSFACKTNDIFRQQILAFQERMCGAKIGYVPGVIRHHFHGSKVNRKYAERWKILAKYDYNPDLHITTDEGGIIIPTGECPREFIDDIYQYFLERNEDE